MSSAILLVGSPAGKKSTSHSLGSYLTDKLAAAGWQTGTELVYAAKGDTQRLAEIAARCAGADLLIMAFPLYVDQLPAPVVDLLLALAEQRQQNTGKQQKLLCIVNSGVPEAHQSDIAVAIVQNFAQSNGYTWLGGLTLGMGATVSGLPLGEGGSKVRNIVKALDLAATDIISGSDISAKAIATLSKQTIPLWMYLWIANRRWGKTSKLSKQQLSAKPYEDSALI